MRKETQSAEMTGEIMSMIASHAYVAEEILNSLVEATSTGEFDKDRVGAQIVALTAAVQQIGWAADFGGSDVLEMRGGAEEWFLPPSYHHAKERAEEAQAGSQ